METEYKGMQAPRLGHWCVLICTSGLQNFLGTGHLVCFATCWDGETFPFQELCKIPSHCFGTWRVTIVKHLIFLSFSFFLKKTKEYKEAFKSTAVVGGCAFCGDTTVHSISWNVLGVTFNKMCCLTASRKTSWIVKMSAMWALPARWHAFLTVLQKAFIDNVGNGIVLLDSVLEAFVD